MVSEKLDSEEAHVGTSVEALKRDYIDNLLYHQGRYPGVATPNDFYMAFSFCIRDRLLYRALNLLDTLAHSGGKVVSYFSAEYLLGPQLENNLLNLGISEAAKETLKAFPLDLEDMQELEREPGLGNGGLGRLAACYLDSLATLDVPAIAYGIRYEFGMFNQEIHDGWQVEHTDKWLSLGNPWEIFRPEVAVQVKFGGYTVKSSDEQGNLRVNWVPDRVLKGIAYDTEIAGYRSNICNILRLWQAEAVESFDFAAFNVGDYYRAVEQKMYSENITKVLYPNDEMEAGKHLRLEQQYFFVSCSLQDMIRLHLLRKKELSEFPDFFAVQLNDTHPAFAIAELMRLLIDEHRMNWDEAWEITVKTFAYTNHTLLPEALEKWPVGLLQDLLPRILEIIYEINRRFLDEVRMRYPNDQNKIERMSLIDEKAPRYVRMANLACVGSHAVNGVSPLHTELFKEQLMPDFVDLWPQKFLNITNGITPRRFLLLSNPKLASLISSKIGDSWIKNLDELKKLVAFAEDPEFQNQWRKVKQENKQLLADHIQKRTGVVINPKTLFDMQIKRIHEYKRQHLNVLHIIYLYNQIRKNPSILMTPRTFIFGGKAAPGYFMAKLIIKLINSVAEIVNRDPVVKERLKVVFFPNYNVKNGQRLFPAADLSEQISLAGKEASGTGNMKLSLNGALTIGTLDGANVQIRELAGEDNFFLFGMTAQQVTELREKGYRPKDYYEQDADLKEAIDLIDSGLFSHGDRFLFKPLLNQLLNQDPYMLLAEFRSYVNCQAKVSEAYLDEKLWTKMSILNMANMGYFSSDRAIVEYCRKIWGTKPLSIRKQDLLDELFNPPALMPSS